MKKLSIIAAAVLSSTLALSAFAQTTTRAEVKAEAKDAVKTAKTGDGDASVAPKAKSTAARADVKADAASANKAGATAEGQRGAKVMKSTSTKERAAVKAEAKDAVKKGETATGQAGQTGQGTK